MTKVHAAVAFGRPRPNSDAGWWKESGSKSLIFHFGVGPEETVAGAVVEFSKPARLQPGTSAIVTLDFWSPYVDRFLHVGEPFKVWYGGIVGFGVVFGQAI